MIAFLLRFDFSVLPENADLLKIVLLLAVVIKLPVFVAAGLHRGWWQYVGIGDVFRVLRANIVASILLGAAVYLLVGPRFPRSICVIDLLLCFFMTGGLRFTVRVYNELLAAELPASQPKGILIYGAGLAGATLAREIRANKELNYKIIGFLDDDVPKRGAVIMEARVLGGGRDAAMVVDHYKQRSTNVEEIIIAMPSATGRQMREAVANCRSAGVPCKTVPGLSDLLEGKVLSAQIRDLSVTDLLGREPVHLQEGCIRSTTYGRSVLVTGAAGSIGSELCRQIADFEPRRLVILDQAESDLFRIDLELKRRFPDLRVIPQIGNIRDGRSIDSLLERYPADSIFHAAAYKHVPMMEGHPLAAAETNVLGTWNLVRAAQRHGTSSFLMISSDKAVNPVNIMGLTKRVAELVVGSCSAGSRVTETKFVSVRFGNVLGSNGSVVPLFQEQIASGGPVTVTHPEVRRYFMTTREAVQLVLQASTMGKESEVFVLDMGEPIRIVDLARNMIRLSGLEPDDDIEIRYTGLRPGEKLFEELALKGENILSTYHEKIKIFKGPSFDSARIKLWLLELEALLRSQNEQAVVEHLRVLVPEYEPEGIWEEVQTTVRPPKPMLAETANLYR
jgi:FlaA1/EpsC-like NDP-sugar epimerase